MRSDPRLASSPILLPAPASSPACCWRTAIACSAWSRMPTCARPGKNFCAPIRISPAWRARPKPRRSPITASILSPRPRRPTGLIARRRGVSSFASAGPAAGRCCSGTNGERTRRHFSARTSSCCWSTAPTIRMFATSAPRSRSRPFSRPRHFRSALLNISRNSTIPRSKGRLLSSSYTPQAERHRLRADAARIAADI